MSGAEGNASDRLFTLGGNDNSQHAASTALP
jgi:hypothetical protein